MTLPFAIAFIVTWLVAGLTLAAGIIATKRAALPHQERALWALLGPIPFILISFYIGVEYVARKAFK